MGLTDIGFIVMLLFVVVLTVAATVAVWPRLAGGGVTPVLSRLGMLAVTQVTILIAVLAVVNRHYVFYSGWDDLFGTNAVAGKIKHDQARATGGPLPVSPAAQTTVKRLRTHSGRQNPARDGALDAFHIDGQVTGLQADTYVLLPPQYFQPAYAGTRFPVVFMVTGYPGNPSALLKGMRFPNLVREGERSGKVRPAIYVLMRPTLVPPRDTECTDVPGGPQVESFFVEDLPVAVSAHYRVADGPGSRAIMGDSTGGYCAVKMAMRHVSTFPVAVSLSGYFAALQDLTTGDLYGGSRAVRNENDLLWREQHLPAPPVSILVASCKIGEKTYPQAVRFLSRARPPMQVDSLFLPSGGHNFRTFGRMIPAALQWISGHLKAV